MSVVYVVTVFIWWYETANRKVAVRYPFRQRWVWSGYLNQSTRPVSYLNRWTCFVWIFRCLIMLRISSLDSLFCFFPSWRKFSSKNNYFLKKSVTRPVGDKRYKWIGARRRTRGDQVEEFHRGDREIWCSLEKAYHLIWVAIYYDNMTWFRPPGHAGIRQGL